MDRRMFLLASLMVALATFVLGIAASTSTASAQPPDTCCVHIYNNTASCHAIICVNLPGGGERCVDVLANTREHFRYECDANTVITVKDVCGVPHRLHLNQCIRVPLRGGCCGIICLRLGHDGCYYITIDEGAQPCPC